MKQGLGSGTMDQEPSKLADVEFYSGYKPGLIGEITRLHAVYYYEHWGFHLNFETQVATELSNFCLKFNPDFDGLWSAYDAEGFVGSVAIDGALRNEAGARLRWFIVLPEFQGKGIGRSLFRMAMDSCYDKKFPRVFLWTFKGLEAARSLYESEGFRISEDHVSDGWGSKIIEQKFALDIKESV